MAHDRVLVTGAGGLVGAHLVRRLVARGAEVRAGVRPGGDRRNLSGLPVEVVEVDVRDRDGLYRALRGCRVFHHLAADYRFGGDPEEIRSSAVDGAMAALDAAHRRGEVERIVLTSSVAAVGRSTDPGEVLDESAEWNYEGLEPYIAAKHAAERAALGFARAHRLPLVVVNPAAILGWFDRKPTPTGRIVLEFLLGRMPVLIRSGMSVVDADDVAQGHLDAAERGVPGERYILAGENLTYGRAAARLATLTGLAAPRRTLWRGPAVAGAFLIEQAERLAGREPAVTWRAAMEGADRFMFYRSDKAAARWGYAPRPASEVLARSVAWMIRDGKVPAERRARFRLDPVVEALLAGPSPPAA